MIKEVKSSKELKQFVQFPNRLYRKNPYYVPQLESADMDALSPDKNHAFEFCEAKYWLALDGNGNIVGRIAGIINRLYNEKTGIRYARFGWLDFIDDPGVSQSLFKAAEAWAREKGMEYICGPIGFLEFDASGVLVEGFDELPTAYGKYNYPYYEEHIKRLGYGKDTDWVEFQIAIPDQLPETVERTARLVCERYNVRTLELKTVKEASIYFDQIFGLMNKAYDKLHGYSVLSRGQIEDLKAQFLPNINMKFVTVVVDENGKVIAFGVCMPSLSKALQKAGGKLFPFGFIHILKALRHNDTLDFLLIAVDDEYRNKGIHALIFEKIYNSSKEFGIKWFETTRELEDNVNVQNLWNRFSPRLHKRARCYIKKVDAVSL